MSTLPSLPIRQRNDMRMPGNGSPGQAGKGSGGRFRNSMARGHPGLESLGGGDLTDEELATWINGGGTPANRTDTNRMYRLGLLARNGKVTDILSPLRIIGDMGELLADVLAAHPDPHYMVSTRSTREWAYRLRRKGWPVRHTKWGGGGYYLAAPVESGWRIER